MPPPSQTVDYIPPSHGDSVLKALGGTVDWLQNTPTDAPASSADTAPGGAVPFPAHRYTFGGEIARGGMGAVLRGRDEDLGREIAVKVMLDTHRGKPEFLHRFIAEARIAGQLQHPGVTPVYELGRFPDDRPYFSMKLVRGETLAHLLQARPDPATDRSRFVKLFEDVCQTLAYAHAHGVIHRDLKPHNIMVGAFGEVQVMDWGLAKSLRQGDKETGRQGEETRDAVSLSPCLLVSPSPDPDGQTRAGEVLGTPSYMPPEQARGEMDQVDTRSDVFSLGAILCEILTGAPPYPRGSMREVIAHAQAGDVTDALARLDRCGADAELIALARRCLAPRKEDRPRDAGVLTQELSAYLQGVDQRLRQAELAAVAAQTKATEEGKRRRVTFRLAAGILLALAAGLAVSLWQMQRAFEAERQANHEHDEKQKALVAAQNRLVHIEKGNDLLAAIFADVDVNAIKKRGDTVEVVLGERLKDAAAQLRGAAIGDPLVTAKIQFTLGTSLVGWGHYADGLRLLEECRATRTAQLGADHQDTLVATQHLANAYRNAGEPAKAITLLEQIRATLLRRHVDDLQFVFPVLDSLALAYQSTGQWDRAVPLHEQVCAAYEQHLGPDDPKTLTALNNLALAYQETKQLPKAIALYERIRQAREKQFGEEHPSLLPILNNLATAYRAAGQTSRAILMLERLRTASAKHLGADHPHTLSTLNNLGDAYRATRQLDKAIPLLEEVLDARTKKLGANHPSTITSMNNLAGAYEANRQLDKALPLYEQAAQGVEKGQFQHEYVNRIVSNLIKTLEQQKHFDRAEVWRRKSLAVTKERQGTSHLSYGAQLSGLGQNLMRQQKWSEAEAVFRECLTIQEKTMPDVWQTFHTRSMLGAALSFQERYSEAEPLVLQGYEGLKQRERDLPPQSKVYLTQALEQLIQIYERLGKTEEAAKWRKELEERKHTPPPTKP